MKVEFMFRYFMITPVSHLPVANEEGRLMGLLSRKKLMMEMADLAMADREYESIPSDFMDKELSEDLINYFQKQKLIPVLELNAEKKEYWDKPRFLAEFTKMTEEIPAKEDISPEEEKENNLSAVHWYMELVLQNFPDPLFATDLDGNSIFYNERFETVVLSRSIFRNSIQFAERYLRDMNRDLFAAFLKTGDLEEAGVIQTYFKNIGMVLRVITLKNKNKMAGFLYHFIEPDTKMMNEEGQMFPSVAQAYAASFPLEKILEDVEKSYIEYTLKEFDNNISHSAEKLGMPRTTLQNRMRQLKIKVESEQPVPRKRNATSKTVIPKKKAIVAKKNLKKVKKSVKTAVKAKIKKRKLLKKVP